MIGYSVKVRDLNRKGDKKNIGVQLGRHCIQHNIPVSLVMEILEVSKQTVYNWFAGVHKPSLVQELKIKSHFFS